MIKLDNVEIKPTIFPDGTSQVWKLPEGMLEDLAKRGSCTITWNFESEVELIHIAQLKDLLNTYFIPTKLSVPYLPYARQDKPVTNESTSALYTFAGLINKMGFTTVTTVDVHSSVARTLISNLQNVIPSMSIFGAFSKSGAEVILYPDLGAQKRCSGHIRGEIGNKAVHATKDRDPGTGHITNVQIQGDVVDKSILIVDDLCDGGMTFKLVAEAALRAGAVIVHLYVTHGLFTKGLKTLRDSGIKRIFTYGGEVG